MSDSAAAPAAAPAPGGESTTSGEGATSTSPKGTALKGAVGQVAEPKAWGDDDDKAFFEMAKRSPYKAKIKGEERSLDSKESIRDMLNHAQRGIGATKVVEEKNRLEAELKAERQEKAQRKELEKRADAGDWQARKELGRVDQREIKAREQEWESVPPEVRELYEERNRFAKENADLAAKFAAKEAEETQKREEVEVQAARRVATNETHKVIESLGLTDANAERLLPFIAQAINDLHTNNGLELGVDMTQELIAERFQQLVGKFDEEMFGSMDTNKALGVVAKKLETMPDEQLLKALPIKLIQRISKTYARSITAGRSQTVNGSVVSTSTEAEKPGHEPPKILSFGRRW